MSDIQKILSAIISGIADEEYVVAKLEALIDGLNAVDPIFHTKIVYSALVKEEKDA